MKAIGFSDSSIRRIIRQYPARTVERWADITLLAMERNPKRFPGFKNSPEAFCMHGIKNSHMPPDWYYEQKKREQRREWDEYREASRDADSGAAYHSERAKAFKRFIDEVIGRDAYNQTVRMFQEFHAAGLHPDAAREAALRDANRHYEPSFTFPKSADRATDNASTRFAQETND